VFPKEAGMARGIEPADVVAGIEQGLRDGGGVFIAKTRLGRHFVVIDELRGNVVVFRDPARGARDMKVTEFVSVKWDGDVVLAE
jgi:predicted double-glycine peptidase